MSKTYLRQRSDLDLEMSKKEGHPIQSRLREKRRHASECSCFPFLDSIQTSFSYDQFIAKESSKSMYLSDNFVLSTFSDLLTNPATAQSGKIGHRNIFLKRSI